MRELIDWSFCLRLKDITIDLPTPKSTETQRKYLALLDGGKYFYPQCMINPIDSPYPVIIATTIFAARGCNIFLNIMNPNLLS